MINSFTLQWTAPDGAPAFVTVVDYDEANDFSEFCENVYKELPESERLKTTLLVCRLPIATSISRDLISELCADASSATCSSEQTLLVSIRDAIINPNSYLHRRFGHVHVCFLFSDTYEIVLSDKCTSSERLSLGPLADAAKADLCSVIQKFELRLLAEFSPAIFPPIQNTPYRTPAGDFANRFIRVGNIQRSRPAVHAFFFWMLPHLRASAAILADTWSISSIAYNTSRLLARYRGDNSIPRVDMLSEYHTAGEAALNLNLDVLRRFLRGPTAIEDDKEVTFLLSAVNSGRLLNRITTTLAGEGIDLSRVRFLALYRLRTTFDGAFLSDLSDLDFGHRPFSASSALGDTGDNRQTPPIHRTVSGSPPPAASAEPTVERPPRLDPGADSTLNMGPVATPAGVLPITPWIDIDPTTYFPKLVSEVEIKIRERSLKEDKDVYNQYGVTGAFLVHRTQIDDRAPRHHAVFVDTAKLITSIRFQNRLKDQLEALTTAPALVIAPEHYRAARLADMVTGFLKEKFVMDVPKFFHPNLYIDPNRDNPVDAQLLAIFSNFDENTEILIVDDAFVTGTRLFQYSQHLRYIGDGYRGRVHFLVAIARPPDITKWNDARSLLAYRPPSNGVSLPRNTINAIETIVLPNWSEMDCPWCIESGRLRDYSAIARSVPELFHERLRLLGEGATQGIRDRLFLVVPRTTIRITDGSIFTGVRVDQASAFAAVAGGLQRLRTDRNNIRLGPHRYPLATVLDSSEYLQLVYTDSALRASFFRAAHREELTYHDPRKERERGEFCRDLVRDTSGEIHSLALELAWQAMERKIPLELFELCGNPRFEELGIGIEIRYLIDIMNQRSLTSP